MNILFLLAGGASAGWIAYKVYHVFFAVEIEENGSSDKNEIKTATKEADKPIKDKTIKKAIQENEVKKEPKKKTKAKHSENKIDDLSKLKGVGPKLLEALKEIEVFNYEQLYTPSIDEILIRLKETGGKFTRPAISAVVERAKLADEPQKL